MSLIRNGLFEFEGYEIDRARWQLSWCSEPLPLNGKTFDLLLYLVDHADRVVGKDELLRTLWPQAFVEESNLTQHIFLLRKALSRHESGAKIIETVPGRGYRFAAVVTELHPASDRMVISATESTTRITVEEEVDTPEPAFERLGVTRRLLPISLGGRRGFGIAGASVFAVVICVASWFGWRRWQNGIGGAPIDVVIAPFAGSTGDRVLDQALLSGLHLELSQSPHVTVVSPARVRATLTEMKQNPDADMSPAVAREVCERTNSQAVLHGGLARTGQHFLLTQQATSCVTGLILGEAKQEAAAAEDLPQSIDRLANTLRRQLGESRRSIARFDVPLLSGSTASPGRPSHIIRKQESRHRRESM